MSGRHRDEATVGRPRGRPRTVAFYLPQFHAIPQNDRWWGEGFTEWSNVRRARPQFTGHAHPQRPAELAEYDLGDVRVMHAQAALASAHDIDAFCFYFYWFAGVRLLERPLDQYLAHGPDFPFCISWANESWTRRWDGKDRERLITQEYGPTTPAEVFSSFLPYLRDGRYLRIDGAAVIVVHRADQLPDARAYLAVWRVLAREAGVGPIHVVAAETHPGVTARGLGVDAVAEFPPVGANTLGSAQLRPVGGLDPSFRGRLMSYHRLAERYMRRRPASSIRYRGVAPGWDNTPRRGSAATVYVGPNTADYGRWLRHARAAEQRERGARGLVFVNAWNEWAEGAHLEPDQEHGRAFLEATRWSADPGAGCPARVAPGRPSWPWLRSLGLAAAGTGLRWLRRARPVARRLALRRRRR